jgi:hypothetical protein
MTPDSDRYRLHALSRLPAVQGDMCMDGCLHCVESQSMHHGTCPRGRPGDVDEIHSINLGKVCMQAEGALHVCRDAFP